MDTSCPQFVLPESTMKHRRRPSDDVVRYIIFQERRSFEIDPINIPNCNSNPSKMKYLTAKFSSQNQENDTKD